MHSYFRYGIQRIGGIEHNYSARQLRREAVRFYGCTNFGRRYYQ